MLVRRLLWALWAAFIVYGATIPFRFSSDGAAIHERVRAVSLNPFISPDTGRRLSVPDVVQNILLFMPFGALGMVSAMPGGRLRRLAAVTALGLGLSVAVEAVQLLTADRVTSIADVMANTAGAVLGAIAFLTLQRTLLTLLRRLQAEGMADSAALPPLAVAAATLAIAYWQPFDATIDVGTVVGKIRALQQDVWQYTGIRDEGTSIILSVFFATTLASYLSVIGERRVALKAALIGTVVVFALEASQVLIGSRMPSLEDAAVGTVGIVLGCLIWVASTRILWPRLWLGVIVLATATAAALQMLSPFQWTGVFHSMGWFPLLGYYTHTTFDALSHVLELVLLYIPLGFFVGVGRARRPVIWAAVGLTLAIAGPIEYLQGWVLGRYPDVSDIGISLAGACVGVWATRLGPRTSAGRDV
jgi:glycopeptide antibiotics resistance protein